MKVPVRWFAALACGLGCAASATAGDAASRAPLNYLQCIGCHGADGSGAPAKGIPTMRDNLGRFLQVPGGREFIVQVPGVMNTSLGDADIAALMNWLLPRVSAATLPAGTAPYTAGEIARLRHTRPADVPAARKALLQAMQAAGIRLD